MKEWRKPEIGSKRYFRKKYKIIRSRFSKRAGKSSDKNKNVHRIYIEAYSLEAKDITESFYGKEQKEIQCYLAMPHVFRMDDEHKFHQKFSGVLSLFDGFLVRNMEEYFYITKNCPEKDIILDYNVYSYNRYAKKVFEKINPQIKTTVPMELNEKELLTRGCGGEEMVIYGFMPVMVSANCVAKTCNQCKSLNELYQLKDRMSQEMNVQLRLCILL